MKKREIPPAKKWKNIIKYFYNINKIWCNLRNKKIIFIKYKYFFIIFRNNKLHIIYILLM